MNTGVVAVFDVVSVLAVLVTTTASVSNGGNVDASNVTIILAVSVTLSLAVGSPSMTTRCMSVMGTAYVTDVRVEKGDPKGTEAR